MRATRVLRAAATCALALALAWGVWLTQRRLTASKPLAWQQERLTYLPGSDVLRPLLLGFGSTYACYLWIKTTSYFATHYQTDRSYHWLVQMVDMVTRLNPHLEPAYDFAGLFVPDQCHAPLAGRVILERGLQVTGCNAWKPFFYTGMIYFRNYGDRRVAADWFAAGARLPGEQSWKLARLASTFYAQSGEADEAQALLVFMLRTADSPQIRAALEDKLRELRRGQRPRR